MTKLFVLAIVLELSLTISGQLTNHYDQFESLSSEMELRIKFAE